MSRRSKTGCGRGETADRFSRLLMVGTRVLMCLIGLLLVIAPWTEHFGTFDNFPHGQDFELSLLAFLALLCLVLLLAAVRKRWLQDIFSDRCRMPLMVWELGRPERGCVRRANACHSPPLQRPWMGVNNLPLQI